MTQLQSVQAMNLKDTKIFIPEIPKEWENRTRSGHTNIWNDRFNRNELPEVKLDPPIQGLYAERFEDGWYWVCGCDKCLGIHGNYSYIVCDDHNICVTCGTHRNDLTENPWGHPDGFECKPCHTKEHEDRKNAALEEAREREHSEDDCWYIDKLICPVCASECSSDDMDGGEHEVTCHVCDADFTVEIEYEARYTSKINA